MQVRLEALFGQVGRQGLGRTFQREVAFASQSEPGDPADLAPEELAAVAGAVEGRRREFAAGRVCARAALAFFGRGKGVILARQDRSPRWPHGFVGSITHTEGYCLAVVGRSTHWRGIGVDAERISRVTADLWSSILTPDESRRLARLPPNDQCERGALTFSAKEAFFKCQYPNTGAWLEFTDVEIEFVGGGFLVRPLSTDVRLPQLEGAFLREGDLVVTFVGHPV